MDSKTLLAAGALCAFAALPAVAKQHALVVGINEYAAFQPFAAGMPPGQPYDLLGARNDAETVAEALRGAGVALPGDRVLMDEEATVQGFLDAFERLKAAADPGDTLIVTFAGHGAQEREASEPYDEDDGLDEIIMFHDFDPSRPGTGRLSDDELRTLMEGASEYQVVWVFDSCHAGGLVRSAAFTLSRFGGIFDGLPDPSLAAVPPTPDRGGSFEDMPHVTQVLATASEVLRINETEIEGKMHGALSWHFAEAMSGAADADGDGALSRGELSSFLEQRVFARMNQSQQPRLFPSGDDQRILTLPADATPETEAVPQTPERISVNFLGALPPGLDPEKITRVPTGAVLTFEQQGEGLWDVFNHTGDRITSVSAESAAGDDGWPDGADPLIARALALATLDSLTVASEPPVQITAQHGNGTLTLGQEADFVFVPSSEDKPYLTLFNVAANGALQPLYPDRVGGGRVEAEGISATFAVVPPTGSDQLYAVACPEPAEDLHRALEAGAGQTVKPELADTIRGRDCQLGTIGLYTSN